MALAARNVDKLAGLASETGAKTFTCDAPMKHPSRSSSPILTRSASRKSSSTMRAAGCAARLFELVAAVRARHRDHRVRRLPRRAASGAAHAAEEPRRDLLHRRPASVKAYPQSASFAMGKFALRALRKASRAISRRKASTSRISSSTARIRNPRPQRAAGQAGFHAGSRRDRGELSRILRQPHSAWTWEIELRPWVEKF